MTLSETRKLSKHLCRLLKVNEVIFPMGRTPKGNLGLTFNANNDEYQIMLDAVPLSVKSEVEDENNIELKKMIEKYWFDQELTHSFSINASVPTTSSPTGVVILPKEEVSLAKKKGRPAGSKNKTK